MTDENELLITDAEADKYAQASINAINTDDMYENIVGDTYTRWAKTPRGPTLYTNRFLDKYWDDGKGFYPCPDMDVEKALISTSLKQAADNYKTATGNAYFYWKNRIAWLQAWNKDWVTKYNNLPSKYSDRHKTVHGGKATRVPQNVSHVFARLHSLARSKDD
jgi:hypothetical protein